jgi:integrase
MFRVGGREANPRYAGSFITMREAKVRRDWVAGELAAMRVPDMVALRRTPEHETLEIVAKRWRESRLDVAASTSTTYDVNLARLVPRIGSKAVDALQPADVATLVGELVEVGLARESIRKTLGTLAMVLDFAGVVPNVARNRVTVKLPREERPEFRPPTAAHVLAVYDVLSERYRLPLLVLDATGMRIGELEALTWGDVDEPRERWRVSQTVAKTGRARWVPVPRELFGAVTALVAREDRTAERRVFQGVTADRLRTAIARACTTVAVPAFSPHDLRHRRISLEHLRGVPWARIGEHVGQRNIAVTANTYTHVLSDETEVDYGALC